jgi:hypothetical protein
MKRVLVLLAALVVLAFAGLYFLGSGVLGEEWGAGTPRDETIPQGVILERAASQRTAARVAGVREPKQILFGDLHVHSTFSTDAFLMSLPTAGGDGARPISDACDFARHCSALDFWSINDHDLALTPRRWSETVEAIRACNEVAGDPEHPDVAAFLGWEWTQVGTTPKNHYGHKNVILRYLDDARIPARPIGAGLPRGADGTAPSSFVFGLLPLTLGGTGIDLVKYFKETLSTRVCPAGVPVRELPADCIEVATSPDLLFAKLDDWGHEALVIPHGTTWGYYTPMGSEWDKQLTPEMHDPERQTLVEVYSGHGNAEEYRDYREVIRGSDGSATCPKPSESYLPSCWQAGEIIRGRCLGDDESAEECEGRAAEARANYVRLDVAGHHTVPGTTTAEWGDSGQCRDCFLPAFNHRPRSSVQYIMALGRTDERGEPLRFRFGFLSSSDNHSSRPGTGYKEYDRKNMTEMRFASFQRGVLGDEDRGEPEPESIAEPEFDPRSFFGVLETERQASFFLTGGLVAAHTEGRSRDAIWQALERKEVYGTSGPRILLWFDLMNPPGTRGDELPMGSAVRMRQSPVFRVRAVGSFEQQPGCPDYAGEALGPDDLARLCAGECYYPSDERRLITRIEVVRIRPQRRDTERIASLIDDPWQVIPCEPDPSGCRVTFTDPDFPAAERDTLYYVRAIEAPSLAVNADMIGCREVPLEDDCLGEVEERAWSSPIFVDSLRSKSKSKSKSGKESAGERAPRAAAPAQDDRARSN